MLKRVLEERMRSGGLSARAVARETGLSHTTIIRILEGKNVDLDVITTICNWLGISVNNVLASDQNLDERSTLVADIAAVVEQEPGLAEVFKDAVEEIKNGTMEPNDLRDIISYAKFKIQSKRANRTRTEN